MIDPDYQGEIELPLHNGGKKDYVWSAVALNLWVPFGKSLSPKMFVLRFKRVAKLQI